MKAVRIHEYGGPEVLRIERVPSPDYGPGEVLVEVHASAVNPVDWKIRKGLLQQMLPHRLPLILGWDVAGKVIDVGEGVTAIRRGDLVYGRADVMRDGAHAQYVAVRASDIAHAPKSLSLAHASAIPLAAATAWTALGDVAQLKKGQSVLIHGATGGVGSFAVQLAKSWGAHVIGTSSTANIYLLKSLGADVAIDYQQEDFAKVAGDVDVVLDSIGGAVQARSWCALRPGGILVSLLGQPDPNVALLHGVRSSGVSARVGAERLQALARLVDEDRIKVIVGRELPLEDVQEAHRLSESGHVRGKIVLNVE